MQPVPPDERAERRAALLAELARAINASLDLGDLVAIVTEGARDLCASDRAAIALRDDAGAMVVRHRAGRRRHERPGVVVAGRGAGGLVVETGQPLRSDDVPHDPRFAADAAYLAAVAAEGVVSLLVVPIKIDGRIDGLLYVDNRTPRRFDDADEELLRRLADHAAVAIRNAQILAREQRARAEAETANRIKDEFLATLSHELRTPLNAVLGWAITLRSGRLDEATAARALEAIERNARAQSQLIEDLLDISRIVTGKLRLDVRPVEPATVIEAALDAVRPAAESKSISLQTALDPQSGPVYADPDRLQQVVWNLLTNAIKFTPPGGRVEVRLERDGASIQITVEDTGRGITPDLLPHVFDRFRQADSSSTRTHGGLGIGLALVRHLVELQGGRVAAQSGGEGKGATFRVWLPLLAPLPKRGEVGLLGRRMTSDTPLGSLAGVRVVVVEDERDTLELFEGILTTSGADRVRALAAGFQTHLPKPVEPAELVAIVASLVQPPPRPS